MFLRIRIFELGLWIILEVDCKRISHVHAVCQLRLFCLIQENKYLYTKTRSTSINFLLKEGVENAI